MLTEAEVQRSYTRIVKNAGGDLGALERAEALLDELRPESPLRHRLFQELEELRRRAESQR